MKLHRFYVGKRELTQHLWLEDEQLYHQWSRVLRLEVGAELALFNDEREERLYRLNRFGANAVEMQMVTELVPQLPKRDIYLCFSLLKKDNVEWILQKCTELGVSHFFPLLTNRTIKVGFDNERAQKILIEAAEQSGRADIPRLREPMRIETAIDELKSQARIVIAEQGSDEFKNALSDKPIAVFIGPEGGWSESEKLYFQSVAVEHISLSALTLRAETAAVVASALLAR